MLGESADNPAAGELGAMPDADTTMGRSSLRRVVEDDGPEDDEEDDGGCERAKGYFGGMPGGGGVCP